MLPATLGVSGLAVGAIVTYLLVRPTAPEPDPSPAHVQSPSPSQAAPPSPAGTIGGLEVDIPPSGFLT